MFIRPDWRDPEPYKVTLIDGDASNITAWEFLRRNPDYQADSKKFLSEVYDWCFNNSKDFQKTNDECRSFCLEQFGKTIVPGGLADMLDCFYENCEIRHEYWSVYFRSKWGVKPSDLPTDDGAWDVFTEKTEDSPELFKPVLNHRVDGPHVLIPVDLSMPLKTLLQMVEHQIRYLRDQGIQQGTIKPTTTRVLSNRIYIEQLRILDAYAAGVSVREIANVLAPGAVNDDESRQQDKRIKAAYKAALSMQSSGYRTLMPYI